MNGTDLAWWAGRLTMGTAVKAMAPMRVYGAEHMPRDGGVVLAFNHFSWLDVPTFGAASPRNVYFLAKAELHDIPVAGPFIRLFGTYAVRRGESDREAVRQMRRCVRDGNALGLFAEGTRQRTGVPGEVKPGAAMVALQEQVPVVPAAVHGTQHWRPGRFDPVSVAWGRPFVFDGLKANGKGYREASVELQRRIHTLWRFLVDAHALGRPQHAVPPA
ncbi:MAG TPA: lysophospholipid acyltransferase family protein [Gaiellaceae bacterium]|jgi:1-acyl-sn-glycerol-3-phosphate acyltransferase